MDSLTDWAEDIGEAAGDWGEQVGEDLSGWIDGSYTIAYGNADQYSVGAGSIPAEGISRVEIYWQAGHRHCGAGRGEAITFTESETEEEKYELRYLVEGRPADHPLCQGRHLPLPSQQGSDAHLARRSGRSRGGHGVGLGGDPGAAHPGHQPGYRLGQVYGGGRPHGSGEGRVCREN